MVEALNKASETEERTESEAEALKKVTRSITTGCHAALFLGVIAVVFVATSPYFDASYDAISFWHVNDIVISFLLAFGIYRKSRIASTCAVVYFPSRIALLFGFEIACVLFNLAFLCYFLNAMLNTFRYHILIKKSQAN